MPTFSVHWTNEWVSNATPAGDSWGAPSTRPRPRRAHLSGGGGAPPQRPRLSSRIPGPGAPTPASVARSRLLWRRASAPPRPVAQRWQPGREGASGGPGWEGSGHRAEQQGWRGKDRSCFVPGTAQPSTRDAPPFPQLGEEGKLPENLKLAAAPGSLSRSPPGRALPPPTAGCHRGRPHRARGSKQSCPPSENPRPKGATVSYILGQGGGQRGALPHPIPCSHITPKQGWLGVPEIFAPSLPSQPLRRGGDTCLPLPRTGIVRNPGASPPRPGATFWGLILCRPDGLQVGAGGYP